MGSDVIVIVRCCHSDRWINQIVAGGMQITAVPSWWAASLSVGRLSGEMNEFLQAKVINKRRSAVRSGKTIGQWHPAD